MTVTADNGAIVRQSNYNPMTPIGTPGALKALLESQKGSIAQMLPKHITPERLFKTMLVAANRTPDLMKCTQASLLETINRAAELGLDLSGTLGEAYPVPFNNRAKDGSGRDVWVTQCQLIIGYRGFAKLARQSGEIAKIEADIVCVNDVFTMTKGSNGSCDFAPCLTGDRGDIVGAFAYVRFKDGSEQYDFMATADIEKIRMRSKSGAAGKDSQYAKKGDPMGAWKSDWGEMAKKTVFRRVAKWLPLSTEKFVAAMELDNDAPDLLPEVVSASTGTSAADLAARLSAKRSDDQVIEPAVVLEQAAAEAQAEQEQVTTEEDAKPFVSMQTGTGGMRDVAAERSDAPAFNVDTWQTTVESCHMAAKQSGMADVAARLDMWRLAGGWRRKEEAIPVPLRYALVEAVAENRLTIEGRVLES